MPHTSYRFLYLLPALLFVAPADATTRLVPSQFPTIQAGIDASTVGDTVLVAPGTFTGTGNRDILFRGIDIVLISEAGPEATIIDAQAGPFPNNPHFVFRVLSGVTAAARIDGFTITGGQLYGAVPMGAGVTCFNAAPTIANCIIRNNWSGDAEPSEPSKQGERLGCGLGGGLYIESTVSPMTVLDCVIEENGANCGGGAVFVRQASVVFDRCALVRNRDDAVRMMGPSNTDFVNCTIANNLAGLSIFTNSSVTMTRSVLWGNCGTAVVTTGSSLEVSCSVVDSASISGAGAVFVGPNVFTDPRFCDTNACPSWPIGDPGDYRVEPSSPCLPQNNPCGVLIGALGSCDATSVPSSPTLPDDAIWASPNPFSTSTALSLTTPSHDATLAVFDIAGRQVRRLRLSGSASPVTWDGTDENGGRVAPGTYLLRVDGRRSTAGRVTIVR